MANLTGLVFVGLLLAGTAPQGNKWLEQGISGIESEIQYQVNSDGGSFEGSLSYHRLTTEMILFSAVILRQNGYAFSEQTRVRLEKMCDFIQSYTKPNGKAPLIGDADDGRLLTLGTYCYEDKRDHRHLLGTAGVFFDRMDFFRSAGSELTEMKWLYGSDRPSGHGVARQSYAAYPETGIYIYTDEEVYLIVRCGPVGTKGRGGHDHNDQLSFELNIRGADIVVDPGTFVYTASREERQHFRSISAHNVPQYAHYEQNTLRNETLTDLFRMETAYAGNCIKSVLTPEGFYFEGTMQYEDSGVSLRRSITVNRFKRAIEIHDVFEGVPRDGFHSERLHLSKDVSDLRISGNEARLGTDAGEVSMTAAAPIHSKVSRISEAYGAFYNGVCLEWPLTQSSSCTLCY